MANTDAYVPDIEYVSKNIFLLVIFVVIFCLIGFAFYTFQFNQDRNYGPLKHAYSTHTVSDMIKHNDIPNSKISCPRDRTRYSYTFFLEISDFYCNRGYWKCIMVKGTPILESQTFKCNEIYNPATKVTLSNCQTRSDVPPGLYDTNCGTGSKCEKLKKKLAKGIILDPSDNTDGLFERLDLICRGLELDNEEKYKDNLGKGTEMICDTASHCGLFQKTDGATYPMNKGICRSFLQKHKNYCNHVYALDKKVARVTEEERIHGVKKLSGDNAIKARKYDDYDNICSADNFIEEYPELIPRNIEELQENDLINLSQKNRMDTVHNVKDSHNLEGCYPKDKFLKLEEKTLTKTTETDKLNEANMEAEKNGYGYFGIVGNNYYLLQKEDLDQVVHTRIKNSECSGRLGKGNNIYVSKVVKPGETLIQDCWGQVIKNYPYQNPGVWLHPFINNIRIVLTTNTTKSYSQYVNDFVHANKGNPSNYEVVQVEYDTPEHPGVEDHITTSVEAKGDAGKNTVDINKIITDDILKKDNIISFGNQGTKYIIIEIKDKKITLDKPLKKDVKNLNIVRNKSSVETGCQIGTVGSQNNYFREYFDIFNIPIQREFHLSIVINGSICEVYLDGELNQTQKLFGQPTYNEGPLQINPESFPKLGGVVRKFKYFPQAIDYKNIQKIIQERKAKQSLGGEPRQVPREHGHFIEISHEHEYHPQEEANHRHSVGDDDIPKSYY